MIYNVLLVSGVLQSDCYICVGLAKKFVRFQVKVDTFKKIFFVVYFLATLGLRCCAWPSLVAVSGGYSLLRCVGFSLRWLLLLWSTGSRRVGFSSRGSRASAVVARRL